VATIRLRAFGSNRGGRLAAAVAFSVLVHAAGLPGALDYIDSGLSANAPHQENLEGEWIEEEEVEREEAVVEEPLPEPEERELTEVRDETALHDDPNLEIDADFEPPEVAPVDFRAWPRAAQTVPHPVARRRPRGEPKTEELSGEAPMEAEIPAPVAPVFPESPPDSLLAGLPGGGYSSGKARTVLGKEERSALRKKVYAQTHYPEEAAELEMEGVVVVGFRLDGAGRPHDIHITRGEEVHLSLREEAEQMVKRGAPYPVPALRQSLTVFVAVAYLNTSESPADRISVIVASGDSRIDERAREIAAQDAALSPAEGWQVAAWPLTAEFEFVPGSSIDSVRLVSFGGDARFKSVILDRGPQMLAAPSRTGWLRIPIQFKILDQ